MKKLLLIACATISLSAQAQYFNHDYGTSFIEQGQCGMNTSLNHTGFIISGISTNPANGNAPTTVAYSDSQGNIPGAPYFSKAYRIKTPTGINMNSREGRVLELSSNYFGVAGSAGISANGIRYDYIYYLQLDTNGAVSTATLYNCPFANIHHLNAMAPSPGAAALYLSGYIVDNTTGANEIFVMKINFNGALIWSRTYVIPPSVVGASTIDVAHDLVEDPMNGGLFVVGRTNYAGSLDGYIMRLNPANGIPLWMDTYGTSGSDDRFTSIALSSDAATNYGYILGGRTDAVAGDVDGWMLRMDNTFAPSWSWAYDYNAGNVDNGFADVMERIDSLGNYEYYAGGITAVSTIGVQGMEVDKVNAAGNSLGQYTYGDINGAALASIDKRTTATKGISMFGYRLTGSLGSSDHTIYKAYFNGVTSCDGDTNHIIEDSGPGYMNTYNPDTVYTFQSYATTVNVNAATDQQICSSTSVAGGSNKSMAISDEPATGISIYNTDEKNNYIVAFENAKAGNVMIAVNDMYGRILYSAKRILQDGENNIPVDLNAVKLSSGIYVITVTQGKLMKSKKVSMIR